MSSAERIAARRRVRRRRRMLALGAVLALTALIVVVLVLSRGGSGSGSAVRRPGATAHGHGGDSAFLASSAPAGLAAHRLAATLPLPLQDAAAVALHDGTLALLGGLDGNDTSTAGVLVFDGSQVSLRARLPIPQHDAQGVLLGNEAYVFGGGQVSSYDHILRFDPPTSSVSQVGTLPRATSDAAVAGIGGTAYVVGGYDGAEALDTIVAWRPGSSARTVARLPLSLRYASVAAVAGQLVIAGGTHGEAAQREILRFDPANGTVASIGRLPRPLTHAPALALRGSAYVLGGRGSAADSQTSRSSRSIRGAAVSHRPGDCRWRCPTPPRRCSVRARCSRAGGVSPVANPRSTRSLPLREDRSVRRAQTLGLRQGACRVAAKRIARESGGARSTPSGLLR